MTALMERYGGKWLSFGAGGGALLVLVILLTSAGFRVSRIELERDYGSPPPLIDENSLKGLLAWTLGANVFTLNTGALALEIAKQPSVLSAAVDARIDGTLIIRVTYRTPVANWQVGDKTFLVDGAGALLAEGREDSLGLTVMDMDRSTASAGDRVSPRALEAAYKLQKNLPVMEVVPVRIAYSSPAGFVITDERSREITFGPPEFLAAKLVALRAVLDDAARSGVEVARIDLRPLDRPTYQILKRN